MDTLSLLRPVASLLSPGGRRGRLAILIYHRIVKQADPINVNAPDAASFDWQMRLIAQHFNPLSLTDGVQQLQDRCLPPRAIAITFDDGYADNFNVALPILKRYQLPATFFIATGFLDGGRMWNDTVVETVRRLPDGPFQLDELNLDQTELKSQKDRAELAARLILRLKRLPMQERLRIAGELMQQLGASAALPDNLMMTKSELQAMSRETLMTIGSHTVNHPSLTQIDADAARQEITAGKLELEQLIGKSVHLFAYPNGKPNSDYFPEHAELVRQAGYTAAVSTAWGAANASTSRWHLPRFTPWDDTPTKFMRRLIWNYHTVR